VLSELCVCVCVCVRVWLIMLRAYQAGLSLWHFYIVYVYALVADEPQKQ